MAMIHQAIKKQDETIKGFKKSTSSPEDVETHALLQDNAPILKEKSLIRGSLSGAGNRNRTCDPLVTNQVLYLLSYTGYAKYSNKKRQFFK